MPQDDQGSTWSAMEKEPTPVMVGGAAHQKDHAGAALRALGSIWLVTLMFLSLVVAAISVGNYFMTQSKLGLDSDGAQLNSARSKQLERVTELLEYKKQLDATHRMLREENMIALNLPEDEPPYKPPSLWREVEGWQRANLQFRKQIEDRKAEKKKGGKPASSPRCTNWRDPACQN